MIIKQDLRFSLDNFIKTWHLLQRFVLSSNAIWNWAIINNNDQNNTNYIYICNWPLTDESSLAIPIDEIREVKSSLGASFEK